jgi:hypothetical protein
MPCMTSKPIICFGQQPNGFFPKRFLVAKINTARKIQSEIGGRIVFFYHDSDADYRETITIFRDKVTGAEVRLNFTQENKVQKKFSPLYLKRIPEGWKEEILKQLPRFISGNYPHPTSPLPPTLKLRRTRQGEGKKVPHSEGEGNKNLIEIFKSVNKHLVADFCLEMYKKMGLLDGVEIVRSSDKNFREQAPELAEDYFADVEYQGEVVRAQLIKGRLMLHEGGGKYFEIPLPHVIQKAQQSPGRDQRFAWMQSVIGCTHYIYGEGEKEYLDTSKFPEIKFIDREKIDEQNYAWLPNY